MIYFKKILINNCENDDLLLALRSASIKRYFYLEFTPSVNIGTDKYFFGHEGIKHVFFTRIKTSIEKLMPKLIFKVNTVNSQCFFKIKFSVLSSLIILALIISWLFIGFQVIVKENTFDNFFFFSFICFICFGLSLMEYRLTCRKVRKVCNSQNKL